VVSEQVGPIKGGSRPPHGDSKVEVVLLSSYGNSPNGPAH